MTKSVRAFGRVGSERPGKPLHYTQCGLDDIYLLNGFERGTYEGKPWVSVKDIDGLHRTIGLALVSTRKALSPQEWRFLRKAMNLTQAELAEELDLSSQQVARYEKGESDVSGPAELALRVLFLASIFRGAKLGEQLVQLRERRRALRKADEIRNTPQTFKATDQGWQAAKVA